MQPTIRLLAYLCVAFGGTAAAEAAPEVWTSYESRLPLFAEPHGRPETLRTVVEARYGLSVPGVTQLLLRSGPMWRFGPLVFAAHGTTAIFRNDAGAYAPEYRIELEPSLSWRFGALEAINRHRLEMRWFPDRAGARYRTRLTLRTRVGALSPYIAEESIWELDGRGWDQNRLSLGLQQKLGDQQLSYGVLLRSDANAGSPWSHSLMATFGISGTSRSAPLFDH